MCIYIELESVNKKIMCSLQTVSVCDWAMAQRLFSSCVTPLTSHLEINGHLG